jgi:hypothetical protein
MKRWLITFSLIFAGSALAWTTEGYEREMRSTIAEIDAHYSQDVKTAYSSNGNDPRSIKEIQVKWADQREKVLREMRQVHTELKVYEDRQLNSSIRIRAKLQQTLGEIQQWRNMELGKIQNLDISVEEKTRRRFDINNGADARSSQIKVSAISQEDALRKLNERADRQLFSVKKDVSSFALKYQK